MSLQVPLFTVIPDETVRVAKAAFPRGNRYLQLRDTFGPLFDSADFHHLFSAEGRPAEDPARLAVITVLQFVERLSDEQAANAVRSRIDWKYLLALPLDDAGFDASVLSEFRTRLLAGQAEQLLFETLLTRFREFGLLRARGRQRSDSTHVLASVRALNRLECVGATLRHALNCLAVVAPEWLVAQSQPAWLERSGPRFLDDRLPESKAEREVLATEVGADGQALLAAIAAPEAPRWLGEVPAIHILRRVWIQNYTWTAAGTLRWRTNEELPPAGQFISSPYDLDAHYSQKRTTSWVGYKVHLTESCDDDAPHLITNVETTAATTADDAVTPTIHAALAERDLLPSVHLADTGFIDAELLVDSDRQYAIDLLGPVRGDYHRQAREGQGFAAHDFRIDWEAEQATCPGGRQSLSWTPAIDKRTNPVIKIKFSTRDCKPCPHRAQCTSAQRRTITLRPQEQHAALQAARVRQTTPEFKAAYAKRAGVEGTISLGVRSHGLRRSRYIGQPKTHLQHLATAAGINLVRVADWLDEHPRAKTRQSTFERLYRSRALAAA
jgi:transposase